jgi:hypothetical protein
MNDLSASHIASRNYEPQRSNNGMFRIYNIPSNVSGVKGETVLSLSLKSFPIPTVTIDALEISFLNENRKVAGKVSFGDMEIKFHDYVDINTAHICKLWHEQVYNPFTGKIGLARNYKKDGIIELFAPEGSYSRYYYVQQCWPKSFDHGSIDMDTSDSVLITMTLAVDKAYAAQTPGIVNLVSGLI